MNIKDKLLSSYETANLLGVSVGTLEVWRSTGRHGLPFFKVGRHVKYRLTDLENWLAQRSFTSTAAANFKKDANAHTHHAQPAVEGGDA